MNVWITVYRTKDTIWLLITIITIMVNITIKLLLLLVWITISNSVRPIVKRRSC